MRTRIALRRLPVTRERANRIYAVLHEHACASSPDQQEAFARVFATEGGQGCTEYRFCGSLGFGGKVWNNCGLYVNCYPEDETERRQRIIDATNAALAPIQAEIEAEIRGEHRQRISAANEATP